MSKPKTPRRGLKGFYTHATECLERRVLLSHAGVHALYAPGTSPEYMDEHVDTPALPGGTIPAHQIGDRWVSTASGSAGSLGQGMTLTYSIVPDGTSIPGFNGEPTSNSVFIGTMNAVWGSSAVWLPLVQQAFDVWGAMSGVTYIYQPTDDGAAFGGTGGALGVRGDVRISAHGIDGGSNILAYNFFPDTSDMVIDSADLTGFMASSVGLRNVLSHEHGHGLGFNHVDPVNQTKLMEPFASLAFDGPQFDDRLAINRNYGDFFEKQPGNNTVANATNRGALANGTDFINNLSVATTSDNDYFRFTLSETKLVNITADPFGPTYTQGPQGGATSSFNAETQMDIRLQLFASDGTTLITSSNLGGVGVTEVINNRTLTAGTYYILVDDAPGATNSAQMYSLTTNVSTTLGIWTGQGDAINWTQATNWSLNTIPGASDDAVISVVGSVANIVLSSGAQSVESLVCDENLTISGGSLDIAQTSSINGSLTFSSGTLGGAGDLSLSNPVNNWNGGTMSGSGKTIVLSTGALTLGGAGVDKTLSRTLEISGLVTYANNRLVFNNGTVSVLAGGTFNGSASAGFVDGGGTNLFTTAGTFNKSGAVAFTADVPLDVATGGVLRVMAGSLTLPRGGTIRGNASADGGATLSFTSAYTADTGALIFGVGRINVAGVLTWLNGSMASPGGTIYILAGGELVVDGSAKSTNRGFDLSGILSGSANLTANGNFTWNQGGTMSGAGNLTIGSTGNLNIPGTGDRNSTRPLVMQGSGTLDPNGAIVVHLASLSLSGFGGLDLTDNTLIVDADPATILTYWQNLGIATSSFDPDNALGFAFATDLFTTFPDTFLGHTVQSTSSIARWTRLGDASLDRTVDTIDFNLLASNFGATARWSMGDFNGDQSVDTVDFNLLASNFGEVLPASGARAASAPPAAVANLFSSRSIETTAEEQAEVLPA